MPAKKDIKSAKPAKKLKAPKKSIPVIMKPVEEEDSNPHSMYLHGELFWEYRAKMAEYERALLEQCLSDKELKAELSDPKYKKVVDLLSKDEEVRKQLKEYANLLRGVQLKAAAKLGVSIEVFLKECVIDHETGVVRILD